MSIFKVEIYFLLVYELKFQVSKDMVDYLKRCKGLKLASGKVWKRKKKRVTACPKTFVPR
jgi:hypothetical protein